MGRWTDDEDDEEASDTDAEDEAPEPEPELAADAGGSSPAGGGWQCAVCTLQNDEHAKACAACYTPREGDESGEGQSWGDLPSATLPTAASEEAGVWQCEACTLNNKPEAKSCAACGGKRPPIQGSSEPEPVTFPSPSPCPLLPRPPPSHLPPRRCER